MGNSRIAIMQRIFRAHLRWLIMTKSKDHNKVNNMSVHFHFPVMRG